MQHLTQWINSQNSSALTKGMPFGLLSFDNAFLNYNLNSSSLNVFDQRTMVARFQMNNSKPYRAETIRKQSINAHALMGLLGDQQLPLTAKSSGRGGGSSTAAAAADLHSSGKNGVAATSSSLPWAPPTADTMAVASRNSKNQKQITVLVATGGAIATASGTNVSVSVSVSGLGAVFAAGGHAAVFILGAPAANELWQAAGRPPYPSKALLAQMRDAQELAPVRIEQIAAATSTAAAAAAAPSGAFKTEISLPHDNGGVAVVHLCPKNASPPSPVTGIATHAVGPGSTLISWEHGTNCYYSTNPCVKTFAILDESMPTRGAKRLNAKDLIFTSWQLEGKLPAKISVIAIDYAGQASEPTFFFAGK